MANKPMPSAMKAGANKQDQAPASEKEDRHRDSAYCVQWRTAIATERQADYSLTGLWLIGFTLLASVAAAVATAIAAVAARRTVQAMRATALLEDRAWLKVYPVLEDCRVTVDGGVISVSITIAAENIGASPAVGIVHWGAHHRAKGR